MNNDFCFCDRLKASRWCRSHLNQYILSSRGSENAEIHIQLAVCPQEMPNEETDWLDTEVITFPQPLVELIMTHESATKGWEKKGRFYVLSHQFASTFSFCKLINT